MLCVRHALATAELSFDESLAALERATGEELLRFDEECRDYQHDYRATHRLKLPRIDSARPREVIEEARLFFHSCTRNGHERERALRRLRWFNVRLTCAAALIRANDWVPQVRRIAHDHVIAIAKTAQAAQFLGMLDLVLALRRRHRFEESWQIVEGALVEQRWRAQRAAALSTTDARTRRFAFELVLRADSDTSQSALVAAVGDPSPVIACWAIAAARRSFTGDPLQTILRGALASRLGRVRADALRCYAAAGFSDTADVLHAALFDAAHSPRNVAAFEVQRTLNESPLPLWRAAFDRGAHVAAIAAALAEHGDATDQERLRSQLSHRRSRIRALALRGLWRTGAPDAAQHLDAALLDSSAQYAGAAIDIYAHSSEKPDRASLATALARATSPGLRHRLIIAARLLGKWEALGFLLELHLNGPDHDEQPLDFALRRWEQGFNRTFTQPSPAPRNEISGALAALRGARPSKHWARIAYLAS